MPKSTKHVSRFLFLLVLLLGFNQHQAQGTSLAVLVVPVTANVQRMSRSWSEDTFHFCCSLFNMMQREEKNRFILFASHYKR